MSVCSASLVSEPPDMSQPANSVPSLTQSAISDCWNKIGVRGDSSCPELQQYFHCRNCPVYSSAAVQLLDAPLPPDYRSRAALAIARSTTPVAFDTHSAAIFRLRSEWLALPTAVLKEIVSLRPIHSMPHRRDGMLLGLANIRGELLPCFSL